MVPAGGLAVKRILLIGAIFFASTLGLVVCAISVIFLSLPNVQRIKSCLVTEFKKVNLCPQSADYVKLKEVSPLVRAAILISEDSSFYSHKGFDFHEMRESFEKNWSEQQFRRGGSTITQQLAKNVFLSGEKSILRKLKEAYLTWRLEKILSKEQIFEKYLNVVELGPGIFGVKAAARHYFQKQPMELNAAEGAFLALLLPNPIAYYTSFRQKKLTKFARTRLLDISRKLQVTGRISEEDYSQIVASLDSFPWSGGQTVPIPASDPAAQIDPSAEENEELSTGNNESAPAIPEPSSEPEPPPAQPSEGE